MVDASICVDVISYIIGMNGYHISMSFDASYMLKNIPEYWIWYKSEWQIGCVYMENRLEHQ